MKLRTIKSREGMARILLVIVMLGSQHVFSQTKSSTKKNVAIRILENKVYLDTTAKTIKINYSLINNTNNALRFYTFTDQYWWEQAEKSPKEYQDKSMGIHPFFEDDMGKINQPLPMLVYSDPISDKEHPEATVDSMYFRHVRDELMKNERIIGPKDSVNLVLEYELNNFFRTYYFYYKYKYQVYLRYVIRDEIYHRFPRLLDIDKPKIFFGDISSNRVEIILCGKK